MTINKYKDRLAGSDFSNALAEKVNEAKPEEIRARLFSYLVRYNQSYTFDQLENALKLVSKSLGDQIPLTSEEETLVQNEIEFGMYEYFISLNHISEALNYL